MLQNLNIKPENKNKSIAVLPDTPNILLRQIEIMIVLLQISKLVLDNPLETSKDG